MSLVASDGAFALDWIKFDLLKSSSIAAKSSKNDNSDAIVVYPNPFITDFTVQSTSNYQVVAIEILNLNGSVVHSRNFDSTDNQIEVNTEYFPEGMYLLKIYGKDGSVQTRRLLKAK